jgi:hypothetical protein
MVTPIILYGLGYRVLRDIEDSHANTFITHLLSQGDWTTEVTPKIAYILSRKGQPLLDGRMEELSLLSESLGFLNYRIEMGE